jgi:protein-disulfide isomerase-like protein with CxxC motif
MTAELLAEVARGSADVLWTALDRRSAQEASPEMVAALLRQSSLFLDYLRTYRDALAAELDDKGKDPHALRGTCRTSLETLDRIAETRRMLRNLLVEDEHQKEFQRQEDEAAQLRETFTEWQQALNRPFPALDLKKLEEEARADAEAGRMIRVEKFEDLFPSHADGN